MSKFSKGRPANAPNCDCHGEPMYRNGYSTNKVYWRCRYTITGYLPEPWAKEEQKIFKELYSPFPPGDMSWQKRAYCLYEDPEIFFPERGHNAKIAREICRHCPVKTECLEYADRSKCDYGMFGGLTPKEREKRRSANAG